MTKSASIHGVRTDVIVPKGIILALMAVRTMTSVQDRVYKFYVDSYAETLDPQKVIHIILLAPMMPIVSIQEVRFIASVTMARVNQTHHAGVTTKDHENSRSRSCIG